MGKYTVQVTIPGDRQDLPVLVSFFRKGGGVHMEYRATGTIADARRDADRILHRLNREYRLPGVMKL